MDKLKSLYSQAYSEGLTLYRDLLNQKFTQKGFARKYSKLKKAELFESKTGLFSPAFFQVELIQEIAAAKRSGNPLTLMIIDLDKLKKINQRYGHLFGDKVIYGMAQAIKEVVRQEDIPSRWGGDEFTLILPNTQISGSVILAARIQKAISKLNIRKGKISCSPTASIGLTQFIRDDTPETFFERADKAVYRSKAKGGNLVEIS